MARQIEDITVKLGIQGFEELNKLRSSFRELTKVTNATDAQLDDARKRLLELKTELGNTARVNKGLTDAFGALLDEAKRGSDVWKQLNTDLAKVRQEARLTDTQITALRDIIINESKAHAQSANSIREHVKSLQDLRNQASLNGKVHQQLGADIQRLTATLEQGEVANKKHYSSLGQILAVKPDAVLNQWRAYTRILQEGTASAEKLATAQRRLNQLSGAPRILERRRVIESAAITQDPEYLKRFGFEGKSLPELPNTNAAYAQQIKELQQDLLHLDRNSIQYLQTLMQLAGVQRQSTEVARGYAQALLMGVETKTVANSTRNLQEVITALRAEMQQLDTTTSEGSAAYATNANQVRNLEQRLKDLAGAYRHVGDMAAQAATAEQNAANARIRDNYLNRGMVRQQEAALAELGQRVRQGISGTPLLLPAAGQTTAPGTGLAVSGGARIGRATGNIQQIFAPGSGVGGVRFPGEQERLQPVATPEEADRARRAYIAESDARRANAEAIEQQRVRMENLRAAVDKATKANTGSINSLGNLREALANLRNEIPATNGEFKQLTARLQDVDVRSERLSARAGRRLTGMQLAQGVGAALSGGIFGGPEGLIGGAAGLAVGGVGGAFAGAAFGAQLGMVRQSVAAAATYAAEIRRLQLALQGIVTSFDDYRAALTAVESTSRMFNTPIREATQQFTKLSAAVIGSGGSIKDAETTFKGLTASVLATGGTVEDVNGALVAAAQVFSKGKVSAEELRGQIGERLAGAFALFAEASGRSTQGLDAALKSGEVTIADFVKFTQFSLEKYGRTAQIIASSPEQAGARLDNALKNLQRNIGDSLGPAGASFQDFATRSVRGIDKVIGKLIELGAVKPGAGYYESLVLGKGLSIGQLENQLLEAGQKATQSRKALGSVGLGFVAGAFPEVREAEKQARILEEALVRLRLIEKETNKERKQRITEEQNTKKEKAGSSLLAAIDQREKALAEARVQREEQIAEIRKQSLEQARQLERQFADERRALERELSRTARNTIDINADITRQQRILAGEDPRIVEAEQRIADIYRQARERDIQIKEEFNDRELTRARTVADFQKNAADQINKANVAYAKSVGKIHREYARDVSKALDESSGKAAKRMATATQLLQVLTTLNLTGMYRYQAGFSPVPAEKDRTPEYNQLLQRRDRLEKQLHSRRQSPDATADRFVAAYANQPRYEQLAMTRGHARGIVDRVTKEAIKGNITPGAFMDSMHYLGEVGTSPDYSRRLIRNTLKTPAAMLAIENPDLARQALSTFGSDVSKAGFNPATGAKYVGVVRELVEQARKDNLLRANVTTQEIKEKIQKPMYGALMDWIRSNLDNPQVQKVLQKAPIGIQQETWGPRGLIPAVVNFDPQDFGVRQTPASLKLEKELKQIENQQSSQRERFRKFRRQQQEIEKMLQKKLQKQPNRRLSSSSSSTADRFVAAYAAQPQFEDIATTSLQGLLARTGGAGGPVPLPVSGYTGAQGASSALQAGQQEQNRRDTILKITTEQENQLRVLIDQRVRLEDQNKLYQLQQKYIRDGIRPALVDTYAQADLEAARLKVTNAELTPIINEQVRKIKELASAYEDAQQAARFAQDNRVGKGLREGAMQYVQSIGTVREATSQLAQTGIKGVEDALFSLVTTGTANFREFAASILKDTARMIIQQMILRQVMQIFSPISSSSTAANFEMPGAAFIPQGGFKLNALGAAYAANGIQPFARGGAFSHGVTAYAMGGVVKRPTMFAFANGGAGRLGLMGEAGPEAIMPLRRLPSGRLGVESAGGGGMNVVVNVDASGSQVQGNSADASQLGKVLSAAVQQELINQQRPGGLLAPKR